MDTPHRKARERADPHSGQPTVTAGPPPEQANAALILLHGRGAAAESTLSLYAELAFEGLSAPAPQAAGRTWYPYSFLAPLEINRPFLDSALRRVESLVLELLTYRVPIARIALLGLGFWRILSFLLKNDGSAR
jgi:phospholipase/carboxylesterase